MSKNKDAVKVQDLLKELDWELFFQQKLSLVATLNELEEEIAAGILDPEEEDGYLSDRVDHLNGILNLLDSLQDTAEDLGYVDPDDFLNEANLDEDLDYEEDE